MHMQAEIIPSQSRTEGAKDELAAYKRTIADFSELPIVINEAGTLMGVRGFGDIDRKCVVSDIIYIATRRNLLQLCSIFPRQ